MQIKVQVEVKTKKGGSKLEYLEKTPDTSQKIGITFTCNYYYLLI